MSEVSGYSYDSLMEITSRPDLVFVRGEGSWLWDNSGKGYLDFLQGWAVNSLGHCNPIVIDALCSQSRKLINPSPAFYNEPMIKLADLIAKHSGLGKVFFCNTGAEANEGAIKLARKWGQVNKGGAYEIITLENSFHGRTLATMSASGKAGWDKMFEPKVPGFPKAKAEDLASIRANISQNTVAIMLELIQGEAGVVTFSEEFILGVRELASENNLLLIIDEVQTGIGRTGTLFASEHWGLKPDIMTLGKGLGSGVPIAALLAKAEVSCFAHGEQGGTYNGNPLVAAVGHAVVSEVISEGFLEQVVEAGNYLQEKLEELSERFSLRGVRGLGLLVALDLGKPIGAQLVKLALEKGLLINSPRPELIRFVPALTVGKEEIDAMCEILLECLAEV